MTTSYLWPDGVTTTNCYAGEFPSGDQISTGLSGILQPDDANEIDGYLNFGSPPATDNVGRASGQGNGTSGAYYLLLRPNNGLGTISVGTTSVWIKIQIDYPSQDDEATYYATVFDGVQGTALTQRLTIYGPIADIPSNTEITQQFTLTTAGENLDWNDHQLYVRMEVQTQRNMSEDGNAPFARLDAVQIEIRDVANPTITEVPTATIDLESYAPTFIALVPYVDITVPTASMLLTPHRPQVLPVTVPTAQIVMTSYPPGPSVVVQIPTATMRFTAYAPEATLIEDYVYDRPGYVSTTYPFFNQWIVLFNIPVTWPYINREEETTQAVNFAYATGQDPTSYGVQRGYYDFTVGIGNPLERTVDDVAKNAIYLPYENSSGQGIIEDPLYNDWGSDGGDGVEPWLCYVWQHYSFPLDASVKAWRYFLFYGNTVGETAPVTIDLGSNLDVPAWNDALTNGSSRWRFASFFYGRDVPNGVGYLLATRLSGGNTVPVLYKWLGGQSWDSGTEILSNTDISGTFTATAIGWCRADQANPDRYYAVTAVASAGGNRLVVIAVDLTNISGYTVAINDTGSSWGTDTWYATQAGASSSDPVYFGHEEERCWPIDRPGIGKYYYFRIMNGSNIPRYTRLFLNDSNWLSPTFDNQIWGVNEMDDANGPAISTAWPLFNAGAIGTQKNTSMGIVWDKRNTNTGKVFGLYCRYFENRNVSPAYGWVAFCWRDLDDPASKWSGWQIVHRGVFPDTYYIERQKGGIRSWGQSNDGSPAPLWYYYGQWSSTATNYQWLTGIKWWEPSPGDYDDLGDVYINANVDRFYEVAMEYNPTVNVALGRVAVTPVGSNRKAIQFDGWYDLREVISAVDADVTVEGSYVKIYDSLDPTVIAPVVIDASNISIDADVLSLEIRHFNTNYVYFGQQWTDDMMALVNTKRTTNSLPVLKDIVFVNTDRYTINQKSIDVPAIHADDMARLDIVTGSSVNFTPGYQSSLERAQEMNVKNSIAAYDWQEVEGVGTGFTVNDGNFPTAQELWDRSILGWGDASFDAIWLYDFGAGETELYLQVGMDSGPRTGSAEDNALYFSIMMTNYTNHPYTSTGGVSTNWRYDDTLAADPGDSDVRFNTTSFDTFTTVWLDKLNINFTDKSTFVDTWGPQDTLQFAAFGEENARYGTYKIASITKIADSYYTITVTYQASLGAFFTDNEEVVVYHTPYAGGGGIEPTVWDGIKPHTSHYWVWGTSFNEEFTDLVNTLRAGFGLPPFLKPDVSFYVRHVPANRPNYTDIAWVHSHNLAENRYFDHEDYTGTYLPLADATLAKRLALIGRTKGSENIQLRYVSPYYDSENPGNFVVGNNILNDATNSTPLDVFTGWFNSPPHYANMIRDWGNAEVYCLLGVENYYYPTTESVYDNYHGGTSITVFGWTQWYTNNFIDATTEMAYRIFDSNYQLNGAVIEVLNVTYDLVALEDVKADFSIQYAIRVTYGHGIVYGSRVTYPHTIPTYYSTGSAQSLVWGITQPITADQSIVYDIDQGNVVISDHTIDYAIRVQYGHRLVFSPSLQAIAKHRIVYSGFEKIAGDHSIQYAINGGAISAQTLKWSSSISVIADQIISYDITTVNRVTADQSIPYTIAGNTSLETLPATTLVVRGNSIDIDDMVLNQDEGAPAWFGRVRISTLDDFSLIAEEDTAVLSIGAEQWTMVVTEKSFSRSFGNLDMQVKLESPVVLLMNPRATPATYRFELATPARTIVETILGQAVDWQILTWTVPANRFAVDNATPYDAAKTLIEAAGGIMQSKRDGTILVRYFYPIAMNQLGNVTPDHVFTDVEDNLSATNKFEYRSGVNRIRVLEGDSTFKDQLVWEPEEDDPTRGNLRAFLSPWRSGYNLVYTDSDGPVVRFPMGTKQETLTEVVEFVEGSASTKSPIFSLTSVNWLSDALSSVVFEQFSNSLTAGTGVNQGYGLAEVTYVTQYDEYYVIGKLGLSAQFLIVDEE